MEETVETGLPDDGSGPTYNKTHPKYLHINTRKCTPFTIIIENSNLTDKAWGNKTKEFKVITYHSALMHFLFFYYPQCRNPVKNSINT